MPNVFGYREYKITSTKVKNDYGEATHGDRWTLTVNTHATDWDWEYNLRLQTKIPVWRQKHLGIGLPNTAKWRYRTIGMALAAVMDHIDITEDRRESSVRNDSFLEAQLGVYTERGSHS